MISVREEDSDSKIAMKGISAKERFSEGKT